jgi:hypothetical protein
VSMLPTAASGAGACGPLSMAIKVRSHRVGILG